MTATFAQRLVGAHSPFETVGDGTEFRHAPASLNEIYRKAARNASRVFVHCDGRNFTYHAVFSAADALARTLRGSCGIANGDRVAIMLPNCHRWITAFVAVTSLGAVAVLIERDRSTAGTLLALTLTRARLLITDETTAARFSSADLRVPQFIVHDHSPADTCEDGGMAGHHSQGFRQPDLGSVHSRSTALIAFTSGSSGDPKGVLSTHGAVITGTINTMLAAALASHNVTGSRLPSLRAPLPPSSLLLAPLSHVSGYSHVLLMMQVGGKVVLMSGWSVETALARVASEQVRTISGMNQAQLREFVRHMPEDNFQSLSAIGFHGEALPGRLAAEVRDRLPNIRLTVAYGLTETNGAIAIAMDSGPDTDSRTCGQVIPSVNMRLLGDSAEDGSHGSIGEICVGGAMLFSAYCDPEQVEMDVFRDGWFATGDIGRIDNDGFLYLLERRQQARHGGSAPVPATDIERWACECRGIDEAAALLINGPNGVVRVVVTIASRTSPAECTAQVAGRLARELPGEGYDLEVRTVPRLPRTPSGKLDRRALGEQLYQAYSRS